MKLEDYFFIVGKYEIVDGVYNVYGHVRLNKCVEKLPVKFGIVTGNFDCSFNNLTSLEGSPKSIGGYFDCYKNNLTSLEGSPISVYGYFSCDENLYNTTEYRKYMIMRKLRD